MKLKHGNRSSYNANMRKQSGVAAIWFGLTLVPIMGFTFWAVEGTRYVQETSRLKDAAEAAAIAVTIEDNEDNSQAMATHYVDSYVREIKSSNVTTTRFFQEQDDSADQDEYTQYTVNAVTTHDSWFHSTFIPSFSETQDLAGYSLARKYTAFLGDNNIDITFVSDFSGSMNWCWGKTYSCNSGPWKIDDLMVAISTISESILCRENDSDISSDLEVSQCNEENSNQADKVNNRIAFVPYNIRTRETDSGGNVRAVSQLRYRDDVDNSSSDRDYEEVNWNKWRKFYSYQVRACAIDVDECPNERNGEHEQAKRLRYALGLGNGKSTYHTELYNYVDFDASINEMMTEHFPALKTHYRVDDNLLYAGFGSRTGSQFSNIPLTNNVKNLSPIDSMWAGGSTAVFQGIMRGVRMLADGNPNSDDEEEQEAYDKKVKMLLILSDGQESPNNGILNSLVSPGGNKLGICDKAREVIPGLYIGVIGVDFAASHSKGFKDCVLDEDEDIIDVKNLDELIEKIEELIRKGSKSSGVTKLY
ncbi:pilus assembly protein TadG [Vibrio sp. SCSIO 43140]|uniref:pilus assembly protein TadG-related protein n=1 Tax=Vibrio sp. SCSIO 43140 TaxID=2819100 RepID=UPI00207505AA|nr:pilus assembly protein TadG-related protein [Vibrio sp. SCSIO 43140]USD61766.1 pilus assembly protein TadG [Vibrio sp. SCSIO 43140]